MTTTARQIFQRGADLATAIPVENDSQGYQNLMGIFDYAWSEFAKVSGPIIGARFSPRLPPNDSGACGDQAEVLRAFDSFVEIVFANLSKETPHSTHAALVALTTRQIITGSVTVIAQGPESLWHPFWINFPVEGRAFDPYLPVTEAIFQLRCAFSVAVREELALPVPRKRGPDSKC